MISRKISESGAFSTSVRKSIMALVIGYSSVQGWCQKPNSNRNHRCHRKPVAPLPRLLISARIGGLATSTYTTGWDTTIKRNQIAFIARLP